VPYLRQAGETALVRSAHREAVEYFEQALSALEHLPETHDRREQSIDLRLAMRSALQPLGEYERMLDHLREAETLAKTLNDQRRLGRVYTYMTEHFKVRGDPDQAIELGQRALVIAAAFGDFGLQVALNLYLGQVYHTLGDYRRAMDFLRRNVAALEGDLVRERFGLAGLLSVFSRAYLCRSLAEHGEFAEGIALAEEGSRIAKAVDQPYTLISAHMGVGFLYLRKGDLHKAIPLLERGFELCQAANIPVDLPTIASALGAAYVLSGAIAQALPLLEQAVEQGISMRLMASHSLRVVWLAEAYLLVGRIQEASDLLC
jgi:tetratricopeptide (TPR) repeat protein